ncbi:MAG TPA: hypothetical protein VIH89_05530 [Candidatus Sulfotelmatobacter sp.]
MSDNEQLQQIIERAVGQVFAEQMPRLQEQVTQRVMESVPTPTADNSAVAADTGNLRRIVASIYAGTTQKDILRALLDGGSSQCERVALFVVKAGAATGWQARGFADDEAVKDFSLDMSAAPIAHAYQNRVATPANIAEMDTQFVEHFGRPTNEQLLLVPLVLKDKVAALLYADGGADGPLDAAAIELLVMATSAWLEVTSLRKQAQKDMGDASFERIPEHIPAAAPVDTTSSFADPFASHVPKAVVVSSEPEPAAEVVEVAAPAHAAAAAGASAAAPAAAADPHAALSPEDADTHRKAQRFARLLVDEIKLYNQAKVAEGRRNKDLYDRLKEDIEKSRSTFQKRYGTTAAASGEYFQQELLRSLAEDDASVMGANFSAAAR